MLILASLSFVSGKHLHGCIYKSLSIFIIFFRKIGDAHWANGRKAEESRRASSVFRFTTGKSKPNQRPKGNIRLLHFSSGRRNFPMLDAELIHQAIRPLSCRAAAASCPSAPIERPCSRSPTAPVKRLAPPMEVRVPLGPEAAVDRPRTVLMA